MVHNDPFILDNVHVIHITFITLKVPSIRIFLSIGSLNGKNHLSGGHTRFLTVFQLVTLQNNPAVKSLHPIKLCTKFKKKIQSFCKRKVFWNKNNRFSAILKFLQIICLIMLAPLAFWKLLIWIISTSNIEIIPKGPWTQKNTVMTLSFWTDLGKQCRPRPVCSSWSSLIRFFTVCYSLCTFFMKYPKAWLLCLNFR